jgi:outer membrane receptor protein involved in Fe transport
MAQSTGGLRGTVLDKDGQPIVGATVSVSNPDLNINTGAATDAKGEFRIAPLPPGKGYSLTVAFPTMGKITQSDIEVPANKMLVVPITLRPSKELTETVKVTGTSDVVDTESTTTSTNISSEFIDALPILGRNYQDVLTLAPGVTDVDGDGNPNIHGARDTDVNTLVDGVSTVDPVTGQVGQQLNINSIQDVEVITSGASAEFDRAQGGFVRVSTKSGGNDFEGSFRFDYRGSVLDGDGAGIDNATLHGGLTEHGLRDLTFNDLLPAVTVSGPIVKDKAWYFVSAEYRQIETPINSVTQAFVQEHDEFRVFGKASWDMSTNHKLVFTATIDPQSDDNFGLNSFTAIESGYTQYSGGRNLVLTERAVFSPNVFLETTVADFVTHPEWEPTTNADSNHNGLLYDDRNHNGFIDATERDAGEDWDRDGAFDVYEDFRPHNGQLDALEDQDHDGRLTPEKACEGLLREDIDCDHHLDSFNEDDNGNGVLDLGEDRDADGRLDTGIEDRNHDNQLNDRPFPGTDGNNNIIRDENGVTGNFYPYHEATPTPSDRDYTLDFRTLRVSGPFNQDFTGDRGRQTLRQDLTMFVPDWHGQHELKTGYVIEREHYDQTTNLRPLSEPNLKPPTTGAFIATIGVILPAENQVENTATSLTGALYVHDTFKPVPNLTLNLGVRFTRESTDSFGYSQFDPSAQRALFDRLGGLTGLQLGKDDTTIGDNDGQQNNGICDDQLFFGTDPGCKDQEPDLIKEIQNGLQKVKISRLTQHHTSTSIAATSLATLFPEALNPDGTLNRDRMRELGAVFQTEEPFRLTNNNLAPRLAVSWDPFADSKTKVFASWGRFYDKLFLNSVVREEGPDTIQRYYKKDTDFVSASGLPNNGYGDPLSKAPPSTYQIDRGLQTPFTDEWSVGFERELAPEVSLSLRYIRRDARLGLQDRDINHVLRYFNGKPLDGVGQLNFGPGDGGPGIPAGDQLPDLYIQNFFFNQIYRLGNYNTSKFSGIELEITKRLSRKWQMDASYSYSRAQGDAEDFTSSLGDDPAAVPYEYGYLNFDQRHIVRFNGTTFLPGDWAVGGVVQWATGLPYSLETTAFSLDNFQYPSFRTLFGRVVFNPNPDPNSDTEAGVWEFQPEDRNSRRNKPQLNIDLQASKSFVMGRYNSKLFLAVANLLNTDDLTITTYQPDNPNRGGALQIDANRRFGRRYSIGFQFEF